MFRPFLGHQQASYKENKLSFELSYPSMDPYFAVLLLLL
jgi:hypothetical protein